MSAKTEDVEAAIIYARELIEDYGGHIGAVVSTILASHAAQAERIAGLEAAGQAVVERWDSPLWKDVEPTAHVIGRLHALLSGKAS